MEQTNRLIDKYIKRIMIDYPEEDKIHIDLVQFAQELCQSFINNSPLLDENNDIDTIGKCANCGVEFHIHKSNDC